MSIDDDQVAHWSEHNDHADDGAPEQEEIPDDVCVDAGGEIHPEHDFPPEGGSNECYRCGAEADDPEDTVTGGYSAEPPF